jgi:DNA mismatch endonuclease, patch repair protein
MSRRSASYAGLAPAGSHASTVGKANRAVGTQPELLLRRTLWGLGLRYRLANRGLPGKPDLVILSRRVVVFCDGDFWHGRRWSERRTKLEKGHNSRYWLAKIEGNRRRDRLVNAELRRRGWRVIRVWETDVRKDPVGVATSIIRTIRGQTKDA